MPGPPRVVTYTRSNVRSAAITVSVSATAISPRTDGSVTAKNSRTGPAPSSRAASYSSLGMRPIPASSSTVTSPVSNQVPTTPTAGSAKA